MLGAHYLHIYSASNVDSAARAWLESDNIDMRFTACLATNPAAGHRRRGTI
ncbi:hypothetical protein DO71_3866 [Burkholderia pseudomallei]|nr:hypothetical protein DO71_3866 [Burkholderia pseudomallei]